MKSRSFNLFVILALFLSLLGSAVTVAPVSADAGNLISITESMLNKDGTLNLSPNFTGSFSLDNWDVQLDGARGPVFKPAALPPNTWSALSDNGLNGSVLTLTAIGTDLYVGGDFTQTFGGATTGLNRIAKYNTITNTWSALADNGLNNTVLTLTPIGTDLYVGGAFTQTAGGATTGLNRIAKYNTLTNTWSSLTDNGLNSNVIDLTVLGNDLYVGGLFSQTAGGATTGLNRIAKYDLLTSTWSPLANNGLNNSVTELAVLGTDVYMVGSFTQSFGGATTGLNRIAKYNTLTNTWSALTDNGLNNGSNTLAVIGSDLYVGGNATQTFGGATTGLNRIAKYNTLTNTWSNLADNGLNSPVFGLTVSGNNLYLGGIFTQTAGGATTGLNRIAYYNTLTNTWSALAENGLTGNPGIIQVAESIIIGNDLYVSGIFTQTATGATTGLNNIARYTIDNISPTVLSHTLQASNTSSPVSFTVTFSEDVSNTGSGTLIDDVTNPNNYKIINRGANGTVDTASCASAIGGDDTLITPSGVPAVTYVPNTAIVNIGTNMPTGSYRLFVCGTTSIVDLAGNPLAGDGVTPGTDFTFDFTVGAAGFARNGNKTAASTLPKTGFAPGKVTVLPAQPATLEYAKLGDLWLEIPSLNVKSTIVGVPQNKDKTWDVSWLGNDTGWLNGTTFPTWNGNSVLTAHVTNASGVDGPFAALKSLKYGDQVIVHFGGVMYVYEVRETKLSRPYTTNYVFESKSDASYLTLVTCSGYNPLNESYLFRRVVRAVLVSTISE